MRRPRRRLRGNQYNKWTEFRWKPIFNGELLDKVIVGTWHEKSSPRQHWLYGDKAKLTYHYREMHEARDQLRIELLADGNNIWSSDRNSSSAIEMLIGPPINTRVYERSFSGVGVWQIRKREPVTSDTPEVPK